MKRYNASASRNLTKSQSKKAMDHLDGANYRDYSVAPKGRRRNEIMSGEEEHAEAPDGGTAVSGAAEEGSALMTETLQRLYNESGDAAKKAADEATDVAEVIADKAEEAAETVKETVEETAEEATDEVKEEVSDAVQGVQDAVRRRRTNRQS